MAGVKFDVTFEDGDIKAGLERLRKQMMDTTPLMEEIGRDLQRSTEERLGGTTAPDGSQWAPLRPAYAAVKRCTGMLKEEGAQGGLLASLTHEASNNQVVVGSAKEYAAIHQFGGKIVPKNGPYLVFRFGEGPMIRAKSVSVPARPYLGISSKDEDRVLRLVNGYIETALGARRV